MPDGHGDGGDGPGRHGPWRFRRRLTGAFLLVAAVAGATVSLTSYAFIDRYRTRSFEDNARSSAELGLLLAPERLTPAGVEQLLGRLGSRPAFDVVARSDGAAFSSSAAIGLDDVPERLRVDLPADELLTAQAEVAARSYLVVAGRPDADGPDLYFFFSRTELVEGLADFRNALALGWAAAVVAAAVLGRLLSRRTLRPIADAAQASRDIAEGLLATRMDVRSDDEFGAWADAFNDMAAALEQKVTALAAAAERERRFTADVAHELRTPLTSMVSASELLEAHLAGLPAQVRRPAELLVADVRRFRRLVQELLELARLDAAAAADGAASGDDGTEPLRLSDAIAASVARCGPDAAVTVEVEDGLVVLGDRLRFARVVGNLLANAIEHGGGPVRVVARRERGRPGEGDRAAIDVIDTGPGIPDAELTRVFDRFHKADHARSAGGAGLGLAIARQHAEAQGGSLRVANQPGGGARFTFVLPLAP